LYIYACTICGSDHLLYYDTNDRCTMYSEKNVVKPLGILLQDKEFSMIELSIEALLNSIDANQSMNTLLKI
jgi:hypothetical protein